MKNMNACKRRNRRANRENKTLQEDEMEQLRRLHSIPSRKAQAASLTVGIIGALILGTGMGLCMTELGAYLAQSLPAWFPIYAHNNPPV